VISSHPQKSSRRHIPVSIPPELQAMVRTFAAELIEQHGVDAFNRDPQLKSRLAAMLQRCLPPRRKPGRPGFATVTAAIGLHTELKRSSPESSPKEIWKEIYRRLIPRWDNLRRIERWQEADDLRKRVQWRLYAQRRKHRKARAGKPTA